MSKGATGNTPAPRDNTFRYKYRQRVKEIHRRSTKHVTWTGEVDN